MKKTILSIFIGGLLFANQSDAQNCKIIRDSITLGNNVSSYGDYVYNNNGLLIAVYTTDSGQTSSSYFDTAIYDINSRLIKTEQAYYFGGTRFVQYSDSFLYNGNNQVIRVASSGTNQSGPFTRAFDFTYDGSGKVTAMILEPQAETGSPEGFPGSFTNIVWTAGNISTLTLEMGTDTIEIIVNTDNSPNALKKRFSDGSTDVVLNKMANNITTLVFANNEPSLGPAGTIAMDYSYTYTINNDVLVEHRHPSLFESEEKKTQYGYDCTVGFEKSEKAVFKLSPNPVTGYLTVDLNNNEIFDVRVFEITGKIVIMSVGNSRAAIINIENLYSGLYFVQINSSSNSFTKKIVKQ